MRYLSFSQEAQVVSYNPDTKIIKFKHLFPPVEIQKQIESVGFVSLDEEEENQTKQIEEDHYYEKNLSELQNVLLVETPSIEQKTEQILPEQEKKTTINLSNYPWCIPGVWVQTRDPSQHKLQSGKIISVEGECCTIQDENQVSETIHYKQLKPIAPDLNDFAFISRGKDKGIFGKVIGMDKQDNCCVIQTSQEGESPIICKLSNVVKYQQQ